jgi:hypothetical protein
MIIKMGYDYFFLISLVDIPLKLKLIQQKENENENENEKVRLSSNSSLIVPREKTLDDILTDEILPQFRKVYEKILNTSLPGFPTFGEVGHSSSYWFGCGGEECIKLFKEAIVLFTSQFPEYTFGIYLSYFDYESVHYWEIHNTEIIEKLNILNVNTLKTEYPEAKMELNIVMNMYMLKPKNCITYNLNPNFKGVTDFYGFEF